MFVALGIVMVVCVVTIGLTLVALRRENQRAAVQEVARRVDAGLVRTRQAVGTLTVQEDEVAEASYFARDKAEATWLFGVGLLGVAVVLVLGIVMAIGG